jgi:phosphoribosylglycinamide formyltransferase-1
MNRDAPLNLAVLISGRGSNLQALIDACADPAFPARIVAVISNRPGAGGLARAEAAGIPALTIDHKAYDGKSAFEAALQAALARYPVDLICLAGFMRVLSADFVNNWPERIVNIHPSLLPDYKGLDTHARALADGRSAAGCSVHYVTAALDDGPVVMQSRVAIEPGDTPDSLAARVLQAEHALYPAAVAQIARERLKTVEETAKIAEY